MRITKIGEFGLIERIRKKIITDASVIKGIGDDCAVMKFDKNRYLLFTCDMLIENIDFRHNDKPYLIGRKALAASISDIASCGGLPRYALVSLGLPKEISVESVESIYRGMVNLAKKFKVNIVGGDVSTVKQLTIDISMLGVVEKRCLVLRSGARKRDIIFVSGKLGGSILSKHFKFTPRILEARFLVNNFKVNSMIDISDGLIQDLKHILKESRVGAMLYEELIPLSRQARNLEEAFYMGEDFELLFTISRSNAKRLMLSRFSHRFKPVGEIVDKKYGLKLLDKKAKSRFIRSGGFRHF